MSNCNHDCSHCFEKDCKDKNLVIEPNKGSHIKHTIGIVSSKGGVGKSLITSLLAIKKRREGYEVGILDADITGPSIPKAFNTKGGLYLVDNAVAPLISKTGIKIVSASSLLDDNTQPILWRGPLLANMVRQFYTDVNFGELDYLFIDMPPGTADISLTVYQSLKLDGIIIVTTPQDLVKEIVLKAIEMAKTMNIPVIGIVENMSYLQCPDCKKRIDIFGKSHLDEITNKYNLKVLGRIPVDSKITELVDQGNIEGIKDTYINY